MDPVEVQAFKDRIGIETLTDGAAKDGVRADWSILPTVAPGYLQHLKLERGELIPTEPGLAQIKFHWRKGSETLSVWVFVSGTGPRQAREKLVSIASQIMMMQIPYKPGPPNLGDISVQNIRGPSAKIIWAFRNVCIQVQNSGSGVPIEPMARAIQAFMKANVVPDISVYLPLAASIAVSPKAIHVGDQVQVAVTLAKGTVASDLLGSIDQGREHLLEEQDVQSFSATYQARQAGHSRINIALVNRKTLLSPDLGVDIAVLP